MRISWPKRLDERDRIKRVLPVWALAAFVVAVCSMFDDRRGGGGLDHRIVDLLGWTLASAGFLLLALIGIRDLRIDIGIVPDRKGVVGKPVRPLHLKVLFDAAFVALFALGVPAALGRAVLAVVAPEADALVAAFARAPAGIASLAAVYVAAWIAVIAKYAYSFRAAEQAPARPAS